MSASVGILIAALLGALPVGGELVQQALPDTVNGNVVLQALPETVNKTVLQALPPPPQVVVRETYFGNISIDHRAHLGRRAACVTCHGPGRVTKIEFTPKTAHERCVGCHQQQALGPVKCSGCHVKQQQLPDLPNGMQVAASQGAAAPAVNTAAESGAATATSGSAGASPQLAAAGTPASRREAKPAAPGSLRRVVHMGYSAGAGAGPALRLSSRQGRFAITHSFDRVVADESRTLGLLGAGVTLPLRGRWRFEAIALGGFDLVEEPRVAWMPALGARAGLEWSAQQWMFHDVQLSVTGVFDLSQRVPGRDIGTLFATLSTGFALPRR